MIGGGSSLVNGVFTAELDALGTFIIPGNVSTSEGDLLFESSDDIILQAKDLPGTDSEGGDINLYAGEGDPGNGGGDVTISGGNAGALDGAGDFGNSGGTITIRGGTGTGYDVAGGSVTIRGGFGEFNQGGAVNITGGWGSDSNLRITGEAITAIENLNPVRVTFNSAKYLNPGDSITLSGITTTTQLNDRKFYVAPQNSTQVDLFHDRDLNFQVDGAGFTSYGTTVLTAVNGNNVGNNIFSEYAVNYPDIVNVIVGDTHPSAVKSPVPIDNAGPCIKSVPLS